MRHTQFLTNLAQIAGAPLLYCMTLVRLITFRSAICARSVKISSCTPSVKKAFSLSLLRFSKGSTAMIFPGSCAKQRVPVARRAIGN